MDKYAEKNSRKIAFTTTRLEAHFLNQENQQFVIDLYNKKETSQHLEGLDVMKDIELVHQCYEENNNIGAYLLFCKESKEFIGFGGIQNQEFLIDGSLALPDKIEFLIMVDAKFGGLGYGYEFSRAFLDLFFENFPNISVPARVNKDNVSCLKLLQKLGFKIVGETKYRNHETIFYLLRI